MATIHPSRMALIPQTGGKPETSRRRAPSPARRRRSPTPDRSRSRERRRGGDRDKEAGRDRPHDEDRHDRRDTGRDRDSRKDSDRDGPNERRRASPKYDDYRRPAPPEPEGEAPWRQLQNMYPNRQSGRDRPPQAGGSYGGGAPGGSDFVESRRLQRENQVVNVWPSSPKAPARGLSPKRSKSSKKSKRARSPSTSDTDSEEDRRRRERKEKKRSKRERGSERRRHRSRSRSRSRRKSYDDDSEDDKRRRETRPSGTKSKTRSRSRSRSKRSPSRHSESEREEWVVKAPMAPPPVPLHSEAKKAAEAPPEDSHMYGEDSDSDDVGPQPLMKVNARRVDERSYGGALLRGEGSAMAAFLQDGTESRIPRRGEIGLTSDEIAKYEDVGYVMSGSRHRRMNAVRMRKENQVISAEEKRGILKLQKEERERRETILREEFNELVSERLKGVPEPKPQ
ncbi:ras-induced vulval development antagonist-domain-containing protein [Lyophyllum atratum]|nr:ras-induced vulval development antagonist-domain-containing protein [Lyophyllum atratum]